VRKGRKRHVMWKRESLLGLVCKQVTRVERHSILEESAAHAGSEVVASLVEEQAKARHHHTHVADRLHGLRGVHRPLVSRTSCPCLQRDRVLLLVKLGKDEQDQ
jgi:hypothetical protein